MAIASSGRRLEDLENGFSAKYWLETQRKDPFAMETLRRVLLEEGFRPSLSRSRDEQVIEQVAHLLQSGHWHVCEPVMRIYRVLAAPEPTFTTVPRRGPVASEPPSSVRDMPDQPWLAANADQAAIASVLANASKDGDPFCVECALAAAARMASR